jgi:hypothetical protein
MTSISFATPQLRMSSTSLSVSVGRSTITPGRLTFLRSLQQHHPNPAAAYRHGTAASSCKQHPDASHKL